MSEVSDMKRKRLIDANALDDEVMNLFIAITGNPKQTTVVRECKESFRRMIDEQPTVYVNDGWIPVSERLPEPDVYNVYAALNQVAGLHGFELIGLRDKKTGKEYRKG